MAVFSRVILSVVLVTLVVVSVFIILLGQLEVGSEEGSKKDTGCVLKSFSSYSELTRFLLENTRYASIFSQLWRTHENTMVYGVLQAATPAEALSSRSAGVKSPVYSQTNVQVQGVDEPEIVKTDGYYIYFAKKNIVYIIKSYPVNETKIVSSINIAEFLGDRIKSGYHVVGLFVDNDKLVVIVTVYQIYISAPSIIIDVRSSSYIETPTTMLLVFNISDKSNPRQLLVKEVDGYYFTARLLNSTVYLITRKYIGYYSEDELAYAIPVYDGKYLPPTKIYMLQSPYKDYYNSYTIILAVNLETLDADVKAILMPSSSWVYVSLNNVYLIAYRSFHNEIKREIMDMLQDIMADKLGLLPPVDPLIIIEEYSKLDPSERQEILKTIEEEINEIYVNKSISGSTIYKFRLNNTQVDFVAQATIPGSVRDQFSMDEYNGYFRVATTSSTIKKIKVDEITLHYGYKSSGSGASLKLLYPHIVTTTTINNIYVLDDNLEIKGSIEGLEPGERIYSTRFIGDLCFLVTYRRIDPLYAIDLSNPEDPKVLGFLKTLGFSEYLHPINDSLLLGIGYEADEEGRILGLKVSLYNISDPMNITEVSKLVYEHAWSPVLYDYRIFVYNPYMNYIMFPATINLINATRIVGQQHQTSKLLYAEGILVIELNKSKLQEKCFIAHGDWDLVRSLYVDKYIVVVSYSKILFIDYETLKILAEIALP
ncbi:beta-propeller domain-containing protein [Desulfurococcaceae archaeon MEX13E-LK6-19]|nr:beta-propeller domain-containing protein [Desulfurococcaceae archaeon MEX13E-LK6-19]